MWIKSADAGVLRWLEHFTQLLSVLESMLPEQSMHGCERIFSAEVEPQTDHPRTADCTVVIAEQRSRQTFRAAAAARANAFSG